MHRRLWIAGGLFLVLVAVGLAAADKPPPIGFLVWVILAGVAAWAVWWRATHWVSRAGAARDGAAVGLLAGIVFEAVGGEPSVDLPAWAPVATLAALSVLGAAGGWVLGLLLAGESRRAGGGT